MAAACLHLQILFNHYKDAGKALLSAYLMLYNSDDIRSALDTDWPEVGVHETISMSLIMMLHTVPACVGDTFWAHDTGTGHMECSHGACT